MTPPPAQTELEEVAASLAPFNRRIVLTGAGFSKPWGGYLASELWSVIVSDPALRAAPETDRWLHDDLNFEETLNRVQTDPATFAPEDGERVLLKATMDAFRTMDARIASHGYPRLDTLSALLFDLRETADGRTSCIFTLNQDLVMERALPRCIPGFPKFAVPGVDEIPVGDFAPDPPLDRKLPAFDAGAFRTAQRRFNYIKLHGSMNWRETGSEIGREVVVLGGGKAEAINRFPILRMNNAIFRQALREKDVRLLVVGYGFGDEHINEAIRAAAAAKNGLAIWIVDPREPRDIRPAIMRTSGAIWQSVVGHSTSAWELFTETYAPTDLFHSRFWTKG